MESVLDYQIPVLHPLMVHFPLALLLAAAVAAALWMIRGTAFWRQCLLFLMAMAAGGAGLAYWTGEAMVEQAEGVPLVDAFAGLHEDMARLTLIVTLVGLAGLAWFTFRQERHRRAGTLASPDPLPYRVALGTLVFAAAALVAWTAHIGGTMVWGVPR